MARDPGLGKKVTARIVEIKGRCNAGHRQGETFDICCHAPGDLCGFFFHDIFPSLSTFQFGGSLPWWEGDTIRLQCPDPLNRVTIELVRSDRT